MLGVATIPFLVGLAWIGRTLVVPLERWWSEWRPWTVTDQARSQRANEAASVAYARRRVHIPLPGGVAILYRSIDDRSEAGAARRRQAAAKILASAMAVLDRAGATDPQEAE